MLWSPLKFGDGRGCNLGGCGPILGGCGLIGSLSLFNWLNALKD